MLSLWWYIPLLMFQSIMPAKAQDDVPVLKLASRKRSWQQSSRSDYRRSVNASEPLLDYFNGTDLQWYGNVSFGTPMQTFTVVFDTGSSAAEIPGVGCKECQNQHVFNTTASSTFVDSGITTSINFSTGVGVDPSDFETLIVKVVSDTFTILNFSAPSTTFNLITSQSSGFIVDPFDGIVGMGYSPNLTVYQALKKNNKPAIFGLSLTAESVGNAELSLGGFDSSKVTGDLQFAPIIKPQSLPAFWALETSAVSVNGRIATNIPQRLGIIFDSGTSNCVFPKTITEALYAMISPQITAHGSLGAYGVQCSEINSIAANISFTFNDVAGRPFDLVIPPEEFNLGPFRDDPTICQAVINALDGLNILGGSVLKHYYSVWDVDNAQMGFSINSSVAVARNHALSAFHNVAGIVVPVAALLFSTLYL